MEVSADDLIHHVELPGRANSGPLLVPTYITYLSTYWVTHNGTSTG